MSNKELRVMAAVIRAEEKTLGRKLYPKERSFVISTLTELRMTWETFKSPVISSIKWRATDLFAAIDTTKPCCFDCLSDEVMATVADIKELAELRELEALKDEPCDKHLIERILL